MIRHLTHPSRLLRLGIAAICLSTLTSAIAGSSAPGDATLQRAIDRVFPALVRILVLSDEPGGGRMEKQLSSGSGTIISDDGYIVTNHHVAGRAHHLVCRMSDGEEIEARLIGTDPMADIAVIQLDLSHRKNKGKLHVAKFGDSDKVRVGDTVLAMGSPMAVSQSVTKGIVANTSLMMPNFFGRGMRLDGENVGALVRWIGHDAVIYGGNSGGPLVDLDGDIIGVNEVSLASLGGAIPANLARSVAQQIIQKGSVARSWTGIEAQERPKSLSVARGVLVGGVIEDSPAAKAGLHAGDVITEFDGTPVNAEIMEDVPMYNAVEMGTPIGKKIIIKALRNGREQRFELVTTARGKADGKDYEIKDWGMTVCDFTMLSAIEMRRPNLDGVCVTSLEAGGPAASAIPDLEPGDVIVSVDGRAVKSVADLRHITADLLKDNTTQRTVRVLFERGVSQYLTVAKLPHRESPPEEAPRKPGLQMILQPVGSELAEVLEIKSGVRVAFVFPGRAADKAGIRTGDILTRFDGDAIRCQQPEDVGQFLSRVRKYKLGSQVGVDLLRDGKPQSVTMTLEADGPPADKLKRYKDRVFELTVRELTEMERATQQIPSTVQGVRVDDVLPAGWAFLGHVRPGDILMAIDGEPTPDVDSAERLLKAAADKKLRRILFFVRRGVHTLYAELEPSWDSQNGKNSVETKETKKETNT
jgi:serine protease Do